MTAGPHQSVLRLLNNKYGTHRYSRYSAASSMGDTCRPSASGLLPKCQVVEFAVLLQSRAGLGKALTPPGWLSFTRLPAQHLQCAKLRCLLQAHARPASAAGPTLTQVMVGTDAALPPQAPQHHLPPSASRQSYSQPWSNALAPARLLRNSSSGPRGRSSDGE